MEIRKLTNINDFLDVATRYPSTPVILSRSTPEPVRMSLIKNSADYQTIAGARYYFGIGADNQISSVRKDQGRDGQSTKGVATQFNPKTSSFHAYELDLAYISWILVKITHSQKIEANVLLDTPNPKRHSHYMAHILTAWVGHGPICYVGQEFVQLNEGDILYLPPNQDHASPQTTGVDERYLGIARVPY